MPSDVVNLILRQPAWTRKNYPYFQPNLSAWYDASDLGSMLNNSGAVPASGDGIKLWADKSGNSAVNCLVLNGVNNNFADFTALTAFGTGDLTLVADITPASFGASRGLVGGAANSCAFFINSTGFAQTALDGVGNNTASTTQLVVFTRYTLTYVRSGTTGTYYVNGVSAGTTADSRNYSAGASKIGALGGNVLVFDGLIHAARVYNAALNAAAVLADYGGTVQANIVHNSNIALVAKTATSYTPVTGTLVTINTSGDTGARICGARDYGSTTSTKQGLWSAALKSITTDGVDDFFRTPGFSLAQGWTRYTILRQKAWTIGAYLMDGASAANSGALIQTTTTPQLNINAGSSVAANTGAAVGAFVLITEVFNGASSFLRVNRTIATTGNAGAANANGLTIGASGASTAANFGNGEYCEQAVFSAVHDTPQQDRFALYSGRKWGFQV